MLCNYYYDRVVVSGGWWCPAPDLKYVPPCHICPPATAYTQYCIKEVRTPLWFLAPLLRNPGNGPVLRVCNVDRDYSMQYAVNSSEVSAPVAP